MLDQQNKQIDMNLVAVHARIYCATGLNYSIILRFELVGAVNWSLTPIFPTNFPIFPLLRFF